MVFGFILVTHTCLAAAPLGDPILELPAPLVGLSTAFQEGDGAADIYGMLQQEVPDPIDARAVVVRRLQETNLDETLRKYFEVGLQYADQIDRPSKIELSLTDVIHRALAHSYAIEVQSYTPAVRAAQVVEAEAVFDTLFSANARFDESNSPSFSTLSASDSSNRVFSAGLSKLLPSGAVASVAWNATRQERGLVFDAIDPVYFSQAVVTINQPLLRGFGIDFNRTGIEIARLNRQVSDHQFHREVRDQLLAVERAYWELVAARRAIVVNARLIAEFQQTYDYLKAREDFDATKVEITDAKARLDAQIAGFLESRNSVFDREDALKNLINDPELNLADEIEIVPTEFPTAEPMEIDRMSELQVALDHRSEIHEAELSVESARIVVGQSKNQALPRFDATFTYSYNALGVSLHDANQNLTDLDFHDYSVGLVFEWPIGNRGPRARVRQAEWQHSQSAAGLKQVIEGVILDVNSAVRQMNTSYEQISANIKTVESSAAQVEAIIERAERRDPNQLNRELNARQSLAGARLELLQSLITYNFAITGLERAKGTLLEYNNISINER
jgi:outer membrane protein TolC